MSPSPSPTSLQRDAPGIASFDAHFTPTRLPSRQIIQLSRISLALAAASIVYSTIHLLTRGPALALNLVAGAACAALQSLVLVSASRQVRSTHAHAVITHRWFVSPYGARGILALGTLALLWLVAFVLGVARWMALMGAGARLALFVPNVGAGVEAVVLGHMAIECATERRKRGTNYASEGQADEDIGTVKLSFRDQDASQNTPRSYLSSYIEAVA
ncbi:hypothetical protein HDZ31DRAFT_82385 [Schizophyllum fasciatum]